MFCDLANFTSMSSRLAPDTLSGFLNSYFAESTEINPLSCYILPEFDARERRWMVPVLPREIPLKLQIIIDEMVSSEYYIDEVNVYVR